MTHARSALIIIQLCCFGACGSSRESDSNTGTGDAGPLGNDATAPANEAHGLCAAGPAAPTFPEDFGDSCGMGSNKDVCASVNHSGCPSSGICLWHGSSPGRRAYCTVACDPGDAAACPPRYACKAQGCSDGPAYVCLLSEAAPEPQCTGSDELLTGLSIRTLGRTATRLYLGGYADKKLVLFSKPVAGGAWERIYQGEPQGSLAGDALVSGEAIYFQSFDGAWQHLVRASGTTVTEEQLPECSGDPNDCVSQIDQVLAVDGLERAVARTRSSEYVLLERSGAGWVRKERLAYDLLRIEGLDRGMVAICRGADEPWNEAEIKVCVSTDGVAIEALAPPAELERMLGAFGVGPEDFYLLTDEGLYRRLGDQWLTEGVPVAGGADMRRAADGTLYVHAGELYRLDGDCWRALPDARGIAGLVPTQGRSFVELYGSKICEVSFE